MGQDNTKPNKDQSSNGYGSQDHRQGQPGQDGQTGSQSGMGQQKSNPTEQEEVNRPSQKSGQ
jgi:hypothetical protein